MVAVLTSSGPRALLSPQLRPLLQRSAACAAARAPAPVASVASSVAAALPAPLAPLAAAVSSLPLWARDGGSSLFLVIASIAWIKICNALSGAGVTSQYLSRKLVHMGSGPLFLVFWPLFSTTRGGQLAAISVPVMSLARLMVAGKAAEGSERGAELVRAISRSGDKHEALEGPFKYTIVLLLATIFGWRSPVSAVAICQMGIGDGMADVMGRRFGKTKWPRSIERTGKKSIEGTLAFAAFAFAASAAMLFYFGVAGLTATPLRAALGPLALISLAAALVEVLPLGDDNFTVPLAAALMSVWLLPV